MTSEIGQKALDSSGPISARQNLNDFWLHALFKWVHTVLSQHKTPGSRLSTTSTMAFRSSISVSTINLLRSLHLESIARGLGAPIICSSAPKKFTKFNYNFLKNKNKKNEYTNDLQKSSGCWLAANFFDIAFHLWTKKHCQIIISNELQEINKIEEHSGKAGVDRAGEGRSMPPPPEK